MVKRSNKHVWIGLGFVAAAIGVAGAAYVGIKSSSAEPVSQAATAVAAASPAASPSQNPSTAPAFDPSAFKVAGVWQLSDNYSNSWCALGIYHIDDDGTYWVDYGRSIEESGADEGTWTIKAPNEKSQKGVKAVLVFTPKAAPGRQAYRYEIRSSDRFRFSAYGFEDGDGPTGENITRVEFEQVSNQSVLDAFSRDCGDKPGDPDGGENQN